MPWILAPLGPLAAGAWRVRRSQMLDPGHPFFAAPFELAGPPRRPARLGPLAVGAWHVRRSQMLDPGHPFIAAPFELAGPPAPSPGWGLARVPCPPFGRGGLGRIRALQGLTLGA